MQRLEAHEVPLYKVFCSDYDFRIPDYQRPYAWEVEQATQLLDDLVDALDRNHDEPYFLGSVVLVKRGDSSDAEVIDGQQRLTTLTILLAVLRDLSVDDEIRVDLEKMIAEPGNKIRKLEPKPRLALRHKDAAFFRERVQNTGSIADLLSMKTDGLRTDAQTALQANARALHAALTEWTEEQRLELVSMLSERTFLVVVSTPDLDSAHRIFSVMNARGLDLSPADIFKSLIIGNLTDGASGAYAAKWENAEEALGREDFADLFLHLRVIFARERARRELLKEFPEQVLVHYLPGNGAVFVDDVLVPYADAYEQVRDQSYTAASGAEKVNAWFKRLEQLDNNDWRPPALWAVREHGDDPDWLDDFFRALERIAASMFIRRIYTSPRTQRYADLLRELVAGQGLDAPALQLSEEEKDETVRRLGGELYLVTKVRKYVLLRLDETLAKSPGVTYDHPLITVEHVLPQSPKQGSGWLEAFSNDARAYWTHRIANLVLLNRAKNSEAQNYDFAKKKSKYFTGRKGAAPFVLTIQVLQHDEWTPELLERRQEELVEVLSTEWDL
ncbi:DUF262 domain-containing protein [Kibdelosporangium phytohabitans]|uniref:DUF262 domain-containing protein n=1 Tax=Kibdelosporangium phytohabitans TaxID=860235 RepID=A0A0N9I7Q0_9PSEU|nr:DUF262 domain-containing protein [Kibdelosporangium phytohabitans]ALG12258.1 hypothetical protein AOZ06_40190 [Kibdelosporangium phytohabitans]MBE1463807.1 hypothetical protein [Kibdelosporangium phytohabitans]